MVDLSAVPADILFTAYKTQFMRNFDTDTLPCSSGVIGLRSARSSMKLEQCLIVW